MKVAELGCVDAVLLQAYDVRYTDGSPERTHGRDDEIGVDAGVREVDESADRRSLEPAVANGDDEV